MNGSLRDVVALTHTPHPIDVEMRTRLSITRQRLGRVVPHRVDLALGMRSPSGCLIDLVACVGVCEVDPPVTEPTAQRADKGAVDARVLVSDLLPAASDD